MPFGIEFVAGFSTLEDRVIGGSRSGSGSAISGALDDSIGESRDIVGKLEGCKEEGDLEVIGRFPFVREPFSLSCNDWYSSESLMALMRWFNCFRFDFSRS